MSNDDFLELSYKLTFEAGNLFLGSEQCKIVSLVKAVTVDKVVAFGTEYRSRREVHD